MQKFLDCLLMRGPQFMAGAQKNPVGAVFLIAVLLLVLGLPLLAAYLGVGNVVARFF